MTEHDTIRQAAITIAAAILQVGDRLEAAANEDVASEPMSLEEAAEYATGLWQTVGWSIEKL